MSKLTIGFAGLTHLGTCSSIAASLCGNDIIAFDFDKELITKRKNGQFDSAEPGVEKFLENIPSSYHLTDNILDLKNCDLVFISVDSPVGENGNADTSPVENFYDLVSKKIEIRIPIIILSQVRPGFSRLISESRVETYYQMETLIFGEGLDRALKPERYVVGLGDETKPINPNYEKFLKQGNCPILKMSFESAELAKLSANIFLASTITTTNTLAALSSKLGADWRQISESLKMDRRIGPFAYLNAGLGIGGSNIIRDLIGIRDLANTAGTESSIIDSIMINSEYSKKWIAGQLIEILQIVKAPKIGILGLSYKQNTDSTVGSSGLKTAKIFSKSYPIYVYDPVIKSNSELEDLVFWAESAKEIVFGVDILIIAAAWPEFMSVEFNKDIKNSNIKFLIDPFRCQITDKSEKYRYRTLGISAEEDES